MSELLHIDLLILHTTRDYCMSAAIISLFQHATSLDTRHMCEIETPCHSGVDLRTLCFQNHSIYLDLLFLASTRAYTHSGFD